MSPRHNKYITFISYIDIEEIYRWIIIIIISTGIVIKRAGQCDNHHSYSNRCGGRKNNRTLMIYTLYNDMHIYPFWRDVASFLSLSLFKWIVIKTFFFWFQPRTAPFGLSCCALLDHHHHYIWLGQEKKEEGANSSSSSSLSLLLVIYVREPRARSYNLTVNERVYIAYVLQDVPSFPTGPLVKLPSLIFNDYYIFLPYVLTSSRFNLEKKKK